MQKMPMEGGPIAGPGTGKSDSIKTKLQVHGFVMPVEAMQKHGDLINTLIASFKPEDEAREEIDAKVSDGEGWIPPYIVEKIGVDFLNNLVADATGKMPQPEMGEHGEMMAANGGFADARDQAAEFWKTAPSTPAPIPGRANPPPPASLMADRLATSAQAQAQQVPSLRSQMASQGLAQQAAPMQSQAPKPVAPTVPAYTTPDPHKNFLKNANNMMGGEGALATGLAYDILNAPQNAGQVNGAITGLKQRAGFDQARTPYPSLKDKTLGFASGGQIYDEEERKKLANAGKNFNQAIVDVAKPVISGSPEYQSARKEGYGVVPATLKTGSEQFSKTAAPAIDATASGLKQGYDFLFGTPEAPPSLKNVVTTQPETKPPVVAPNLKQSLESVPQSEKPAIQQTQPPIGKASNWNETGYRTDNAPQTLAWNEQRWSNSGDPEQDAALADRLNTQSSLKAQANLMRQYGPEVSAALNPGAAVLTQGLTQDRRNAATTNALERDKMALEQNTPQKFTPAFKDEELSYLPEDATDNDVLGLRTMPKHVWEGFSNDVANSASPQEQESKIAEMAKRSGIGLTALKAQLYRR